MDRTLNEAAGQAEALARNASMLSESLRDVLAAKPAPNVPPIMASRLLLAVAELRSGLERAIDGAAAMLDPAQRWNADSLCDK